MAYDRVRRLKFSLWIFLTLVVLATLACGCSRGSLGAGDRVQQIELSNRYLTRTLRIRDGVVRTTGILNKITKARLPVESDEFMFRLGDGTELTTRDFHLVRHSFEKSLLGGQRLILTLKNKQPAIEIRMTYELGDQDFFLRKRIAVRSLSAREVLLKDVEVERFKSSARSDLGGLGQPLYLNDSLFLGLEYPAGLNENRQGLVLLLHHPGRALTSHFLKCKPAIMGVTPAGRVEQWFQRYVAGIRLAPRFFVLYNSWYDIQRDTMSTENFAACYASFKKNLTDKHGVELDAFVPDDGWQNHESIWDIDKNLFPQGFGPLARTLRKGGTRLGLWMPLTACQGNLDVRWGVEKGYEADTSAGHYCLSAPKYNRKLREVLKQYVMDYNMVYFKHDFNAFECHAEEHGHLPASEYGTETNVDAYIDMLRYLRSLKRDIFLNITSGIWLSPWWLMHANTVWMGGRGDWAYEKALPALEPRDWELNARDADLYADFRVARCQFPPSSLMYHGIIHGKLALIGGKDEPLCKWTDNVVMHLGRGVTMVELYFTPSLLNDTQWTIVAEALQWAGANRSILSKTRLILGNAGKGEVCGYAHTAKRRTILCLRNPVLACQTAAVKVTEALDLDMTDKRRFDVGLLYPYRQVITQGLRASDSFNVELAGNEVCVLEVFPVGEGPGGGPGVAGCRYASVRSQPGKLEYDLLGLPGSSSEGKIVGGGRVDSVTLDGKSVGTEKMRVTFPGDAESVSVRDRSMTERGRIASGCSITLPYRLAGKAKLILLAEQISPAIDLPSISVNGTVRPGRVVQGEGWKSRVVSLEGGNNEVRWAFPLAERKTLPFQNKTLRTSCWLNLERPLVSRRLILRGDFGSRAGREDLLPTPFAKVKTETIPVQSVRVLSLTQATRPVTLSADDLGKATAARIHFSVFGVEGGQYLHKPVLLNGREVGVLPLNDSPQDQWQERILEVPKALLSTLRITNEIVLTNPTGDCFKVKDLALGIQLPGDVWAETAYDPGIYCSVADWLHSEGETFESGRSKPISLRLPISTQ